MSLIIIVAVSLLLSFIFAWWFKRKLILLLTIVIPSVIILEILITKDVAAFYYRYYYHWLFLLAILLVLPLGFVDKIKSSKIVGILLFCWAILIIRFPMSAVINNVNYLNSESAWFDSFAKQYALYNSNIYDFIDWQYPKTKGIIKWCENQKNMTNLYYSYLDQFHDMNESELHAFFINCKLSNLEIEKGETIEQTANKILKSHKGSYYLSSEKCQQNSLKQFDNKLRLDRYKLDQRLICGAEEIMPNLYILQQ